jgi:MFS family permease
MSSLSGGAVVADLAPVHLRGRYLGLYGAISSLGALLAPLGGTQLLDVGPPALWLTCGAVAWAAALGQLALAPAMRSRTRPHHGEAACHVRTQPASGQPAAGQVWRRVWFGNTP